MLTIDLPKPSFTALAHSERLIALIHHEVKKTGMIPFSYYMHLALYAPGLGYYSAGTHKFGKNGDFVTAPEISPLFAQCLARQCAQVLNELEEGSILELGAGSGQLAVDLLLTLEKANILPVRYYILDVSADLKQRQRVLFRQKIPHLFGRVRWLSRLPKKVKGIVIGNEVLDAIPAELFRQCNNGIQQAYVDEKINIVWQDPTVELQEAIRMLQLDFPQGYTSEINLQQRQWVKNLSSIVEQGMILLVDYGFPRHEYYHADRCMGTLMCHYRHYAHANPFIFIGLQDITTHVDFTAVAEAAAESGLLIAGYTNQASFLLNCGLIELATPEYALQIKTLTLPSEMGELFKVIAMIKGIHCIPMGFSAHDQRQCL